MKKLYRKGSVHPSPPELLSFLPAAILALTLALSPEEKEVLAYLIISCSSSANFSDKQGAAKSGGDHAPSFSCSCFRCYMSYWVKWDASPNRERIHEIIDAFEESSVKKESKKQRRKGKSVKESVVSSESSTSSELSLTEKEVCFTESAAVEVSEMHCEEVDEEKGGSVRRLVSFIGERIWSVWG